MQPKVHLWVNLVFTVSVACCRVTSILVLLLIYLYAALLFLEHLGDRKSNLHLQRAIALHGLENFEFFVIEFVTEPSLLIVMEQRYIDMVSPDQRYNFSPQAGSNVGNLVEQVCLTLLRAKQLLVKL